MAHSDSFPQARIVRHAGVAVAPPPALPRRRRAGDATFRDSVRAVVVYAIGLWPLTCVVLLLFGLLIMAGHNGAP